MVYNRNTLLYYYEKRNKAFKTDHDKKIRLVTPEEKFVYHAQVIMTRRYQGRNLGLAIYRISTDDDSDIIGCHSNDILPDEGSN